MAGRSRGGRWTVTGPRDRRPALEGIFWRWLMWRTPAGKAWLFLRACASAPLMTFAVVLWAVLWFQSGSGLVAVVLTPVFMGLGAGAWFAYRLRRTGLTVNAAAAQLRREWRVRQQWDRACHAAGWKVAPRLAKTPWRPGLRSEGDTVVARFNAAAHGLAHDPIHSGMRPMAEVIAGGCRAARAKTIGLTGWVEVRLDFAPADPLATVVTPNMLPSAPKGCIPYGLSEDGSPVFFRLLNDRGECVFTPLLIVGATRSGKSSSLWAQLLGFIAAGVPVRLWVADPKGGMELPALEDALNRRAGTDLFKVVAYADTEDEVTAMVERMAEEMNARMLANKGKRKRAHAPTVDEPFNLLIIDELLLCDDLMKAGKRGPLGRIQLAGAAAGFSVIACTQLSRAQDLNAQIRDLFARRMVFRVVSREAVETALGSGNGWSEKAPAHRIKDRAEEKGVGYVVDMEGLTSSSTEAIRFRSVLIEDEATNYIAEGEMPPGTERFARDDVDGRQFRHAVYRFYDQAMALLYVGETNDVDRRWAQHRRARPWWPEVVEDPDHMHVEWYFGATAREAETKAKAAESKAIRTEKPRYNKAENRDNPLKVA